MPIAPNHTVARAPKALPIQPTSGEMNGARPMITAPHTAMIRPRTSGATLVCTSAFAVTMTCTVAIPRGIWISRKNRNDGDIAAMQLDSANRPRPITTWRIRGRGRRAATRADVSDPMPMTEPRIPNSVAPLPKTCVDMSGFVTPWLKPNAPMASAMRNIRSSGGRTVMYRTAAMNPAFSDLTGGVPMAFLSSDSRAAIWNTIMTALTTKTGPVPMAAISRPAAPGPTRRAVLKLVALSPMAFETSEAGTSSVTVACRDGLSNAPATPSSSARTKTCHSCTWPLSVRIERTMMSKSSSDCALSIMTRFGNRSASEPARGVKRIVGRNIALVSQPSAVASPSVSSASTSHAWAVRVIHMPRKVALLPMKKWR